MVFVGIPITVGYATTIHAASSSIVDVVVAISLDAVIVAAVIIVFLHMNKRWIWIVARR